MAALPQCIQSAKQLYDLRCRYKDASILITAIYSESMVIAASLSQVQNLLQHDGLQRKPQLLETFDRALTGCRIVYGCLEEEVIDLVVKAETEDLGFKDRARFLLKEDTFKELLTQIRGQQSALSLLIQGLQMESIADIRKLVEENSITLERVVQRSRTLRQKHPMVRVPESVLGGEEGDDGAESMLKGVEFTFDDEVVNSRAYRRAMALALSISQKEDKIPSFSETEPLEDELAVSEPTPLGLSEIEPVEDQLTVPRSKPQVVDDKDSNLKKTRIADADEHQYLLDTLERDMLAFMPQITFTAPSTPTTTGTDIIDALPSQSASPLAPAPLQSYSEGTQVFPTEVPPPLPPRRPSGPQLRSKEPATVPPKARSAYLDESMYTSDVPSILSKASTVSSYTIYDASQSTSRRPPRKPLPLTHKASHTAFGNFRDESAGFRPPVTPSPLYNSEMHSIWMSLLASESKFCDHMVKLKKTFYDNVTRQWPVLIKHLEAILVGEQIAALNQQFLLEAMSKQIVGNQSALCDPYIFEAWMDRTQKLYREYCRRMPHAASSLRITQKLDPKFSPFVNTLGLSIAYFGMSWEDYLKMPHVQLQSYIDNLQGLVNIAETLDEPAASQEAKRLRHALQAVTWLKTSTSALLEAAQSREEVQSLKKRIRMDTDALFQLGLHEPARRVRHQGRIAMKFKSQGPWIPVHVMLLDNMLLWGKTKKSKGDELLVHDAPLTVRDLELALPPDAQQYQKATMLDQIPRGSVVYIITVKNKTVEGKPHMLGLHSFQERVTWWGHLQIANAPTHG
ncbi:hypothetical protein EJ02DRAFT_334893 [Clathrospora elynae]|uniref:DH domain-containing protein n=1 Tax=Clathrospora elynae TaxID=706981 RepID=A0A6A5T4T5_9PLEO|nr:hypothetical protein EJ02DRAFT_334893 [Clathrospora elynae]